MGRYDYATWRVDGHDLGRPRHVRAAPNQGENGRRPQAGSSERGSVRPQAQAYSVSNQGSSGEEGRRRDPERYRTLVWGQSLNNIETVREAGWPRHVAVKEASPLECAPGAGQVEVSDLTG